MRTTSVPAPTRSPTLSSRNTRAIPPRSSCRRLWQEGAADELIRRTDALNPAAFDADPDTLAFRVLALIQSNRSADAAPIETILRKREGDYRTSAWSKAIPLLDTARAPKG